MGNLRIYCETLPFDEVRRPVTVALLRRYDLDLVLAVRPWQLAELGPLVRHLHDEGIAVSLWPMLEDAAGRWANAGNARAFARFVRSCCDAVAGEGVSPRDVLFDLEPPFSDANALAHAAPTSGVSRVARAALRGTFGRAGFARAATELAVIADEVHARGATTSSAVWPLVALDEPGLCAWQAMLGTPVDALGTRHVSVMLYTTIFEGWSRGALRRADATALLEAAAGRVMRRWGGKGGISLGCVGTGAFEDEPVYRSPAELAEDAALVRAAGCDDLALFDLGGVLSRPPPEAWLDAFVHAPPAEGAGGRSLRVAAARPFVRAASWAMARWPGARRSDG